ncbi:MAG: hypothetical protein QW452_04970 [Pyrobaculum sp.]
MACFCGRPAGPSGLCPYHDPACAKDRRCRSRLVFVADCERCNLPGGEVTDTPPRLSGARIHGPLIVYFVVGDVDVRGARGVDLYVYSVRGGVYGEGSRFRHIYVDQLAGDLSMASARFDSLVASGVSGRVSLAGARAGGHVYVGDVRGEVDLGGAEAAGEVVVDRVRGGVRAGGRFYSLVLHGVEGDVDLSVLKIEGDVFLVGVSGDRLDLSGAEVGGRVFLLESRFRGVRVDRREVLKKVVLVG